MGSRKMGSTSFRGLVDNLHSAVRKMKWRPEKTEWGDYYEDTNYSSPAFGHKKRFMAEAVERVNPERVLDLGSNVGVFSRLASQRGIFTVSDDVDPEAVEKNYLECRSR